MAQLWLAARCIGRSPGLPVQSHAAIASWSAAFAWARISPVSSVPFAVCARQSETASGLTGLSTQAGPVDDPHGPIPRCPSRCPRPLPRQARSDFRLCESGRQPSWACFASIPRDSHHPQPASSLHIHIARCSGLSPPSSCAWRLYTARCTLSAAAASVRPALLSSVQRSAAPPRRPAHADAGSASRSDRLASPVEGAQCQRQRQTQSQRQRQTQS